MGLIVVEERKRKQEWGKEEIKQQPQPTSLEPLELGRSLRCQGLYTPHQSTIGYRTSLWLSVTEAIFEGYFWIVPSAAEASILY